MERLAAIAGNLEIRVWHFSNNLFFQKGQTALSHYFNKSQQKGSHRFSVEENFGGKGHKLKKLV
jgi:hypothetical protein